MPRSLQDGSSRRLGAAARFCACEWWRAVRAASASPDSSARSRAGRGLPRHPTSATQWRLAMENLVTVLKAAGGEPQADRDAARLRHRHQRIQDVRRCDRRSLGRDARQALSGDDAGSGLRPDRSARTCRDRGRSDPAVTDGDT